MHVIGGIYKGREIKFPKGIRPTSGLVRESIFNIIGEELHNSVVLDLFAGCGANGIEAISRGAKSVTFIEKNKRVIRILKENIKNLDIENVRVLNTNAMNYEITNHYDIIIADPPYDMGYAKRILKKFAKSARLIVIEHSIREKLEIGETRRYGDTLVTYIWSL